MKILIVCGAGASSTFVALRIRQSAQKQGIPVDARPSSESALDSELSSADVLLVGPHLAPRFDATSALAARHHVAAVLLSEEMATSPLGDSALAEALAAAAKIT